MRASEVKEKTTRIEGLVWAGLSLGEIADIYGPEKTKNRALETALEVMKQKGLFNGKGAISKRWPMSNMKNRYDTRVVAQQMTCAIVEAARHPEAFVIVADWCSDLLIRPESRPLESREEVLLTIKADQDKPRQEERNRIMPIIRENIEHELEARGLLA